MKQILKLRRLRLLKQARMMETHNASIYHCVSCGRVAHVEFEADPPQCCGRTMTKASEETIRESDVAKEDTELKPRDMHETVLADQNDLRGEP